MYFGDLSLVGVQFLHAEAQQLARLRVQLHALREGEALVLQLSDGLVQSKVIFLSILFLQAVRVFQQTLYSVVGAAAADGDGQIRAQIAQ